MRARAVILATYLAWSSPAVADIVDDLAPDTWLAVPNTPLEAVAPSPLPPGNSGINGVLEAWCGGAFDTVRNRLMIWCGGHSDYAGNEVYAFDVDDLTWSRIWGPTPNAEIPSGGTHETYDDGSPGARHTYDGLTYAPPPVDALISVGGALWQSGFASGAAWRLELGGATPTWQRMADPPSAKQGDCADWDPVTGHVFHLGFHELSEHDGGEPPSDGWIARETEAFSAGWSNYDQSSAIDPVRRLMVLVGGGAVYTFDLVNHVWQARSTTGATAIVDAFAPGLTYDHATDKLVAWAGGAEVYVLDTVTWTWSLHQGAGVVPSQPANGVYGRFQYVPSRNVFVGVNTASEDVSIFRLSPGAGVVPDAGVPAGPDAGGASDPPGGCCQSAPPAAASWWLLVVVMLTLGRRSVGARR